MSFGFSGSLGCCRMNWLWCYCAQMKSVTMIVSSIFLFRVWWVVGMDDWLYNMLKFCWWCRSKWSAILKWAKRLRTAQACNRLLCTREHPKSVQPGMYLYVVSEECQDDARVFPSVSFLWRSSFRDKTPKIWQFPGKRKTYQHLVQNHGATGWMWGRHFPRNLRLGFP
jgi:hypothetical protein